MYRQWKEFCRLAAWRITMFGIQLRVIDDCLSASNNYCSDNDLHVALCEHPRTSNNKVISFCIFE